MKNLLYLLLVLSCYSVWAQKSAKLDNDKSIKTQAECQRIADLRLVKSENLKINCQLDNQHFYSEVSQLRGNGPLRLGNFNLLHPGTDKTLFKDMSLMAELINKEFDVMAAVELTEVVATPKDNNLKLLPLIGDKARQFKELNEKIASLKSQVASLSSVSVNPEAQKQITALKAKLSQINKGLNSSNEKLEIAEEVVNKNSMPGFIILGAELGKKKRLQRLQAALVNEKNLRLESAQLKQQQISIEVQINGLQSQVVPSSDAGPLKLELSSLESESKELEVLLSETTRYYRIPGYLKLLEELRKIDGNWSLILSPHSDAAVESNAQEHTGFYYRASRVGLKQNSHCSNRFNRPSVACYPNFYADYMGEDKATLFSRRPFMASFNDGNKNFSMLAAHVVFESPADLNTQKNMLKRTFNVNALNELPTGINKQIYARFVETYITLELIEKLKTEGLERIIYTGDFNLEIQNPFWNYVFNKIPGSILMIQDKTSVSENRFVKGQESNGVSSNYDHFILSNAEAANCQNAKVVNYLENEFAQKIKDKYLVRIDGQKGPYLKDQGRESIIEDRTDSIKELLKSYNFTIKNGQFLPDTKTTTDDLKNFQERVFDSQLSDDTYYKFFAQTMSDHLPIRMDCQF